MPKQQKKGGGNGECKSKGKGNRGDVAAAKADTSFDNMLADLRASDLLNFTTTTTTTTITTTTAATGSSSSSSSSESSSTASPTGVTEAMIV
jgi:hypothetical protein